MANSQLWDKSHEKIEVHLRKVSRTLIKFDTVEATLNFLIESFFNRFSCDYVSIILKNKDLLEIKVDKGDSKFFANEFPLNENCCSDNFLKEPICCYDPTEEKISCDFMGNLENEGFSTWFTVPIKESSSESLGVCVIGFRKVVPLIINAKNTFAEFGKDIANAISTSLRKENEKKKIQGIEWLKENVYLGSSVEQLIENIVERAGKLTSAKSAYIYLYDDDQNCFVFHPPSFGEMLSPKIIKIKNDFHLDHYFPFLEKDGCQEISIPLTVNLKTIGVLHVINREKSFFTVDDLEFLRFLAAYVSVIIENARLYKTEIEGKTRLEQLTLHHQELVKQTLSGEGLNEISNSLSHMIGHSIFLFDRFMHPVTDSIIEPNQESYQNILDHLSQEKGTVLNKNSREIWVSINSKDDFGIWKVIGEGELLGYLGISINKENLDMIMRMALNHALNVYAIKFIKEKLLIAVKEQAKDGFIHKLFAEKIEDRERIVEYANLFNLNIFKPNKIGVLSIESTEINGNEYELLDLEAKKTWLWDRIREDLFEFDQSIVVTRKDGLYIVVVPEKTESVKNNYWVELYDRIKNVISSEKLNFNHYLGISLSTNGLEDFHECYRQALQALRIVTKRYPHKKLLCFDSLGSYSVLYNLQNLYDTNMFIKNYLGPLLNYGNGNGKGKELFKTLRVYLSMNGNLKETAEQLFIHRSSLKYRLERITEILNLDIEDADERFNLMLAYKLYDLHDQDN